MRVVVIGAGNPWRSDDGAGWVVLDAIGTRLNGRAELVWTDGEPTRLIEAWEDADLAILVDAVRSGVRLGTVHRSPPLARVGLVGLTSSSHGLGVADAVRLGQELDRVPRRLEVFGIEVGHTAHGRGVGPAVAQAAHGLADEVVGEVDVFLRR